LTFQQIFAKYFSVVFLDKYTVNILTFNSKIIDLTYYLSKHLAFNQLQLIDMVVSDLLIKNFRFFVTYLFLELSTTAKLYISCKTYNIFSLLKSVTGFFFSSNWLEREVWDMFGIFFLGNRDLRRILTDYLFFGYPLRKDFPLSGYFECLYDEFVKVLLYSRVSFQQIFRTYHFSQIWG
jgi:NADH-quinone oxidoreductase subunit C